MVGIFGPPGVTELQPGAAVAGSCNLYTSVVPLPRAPWHRDALLSLPRSSFLSFLSLAWLYDETIKATTALLDLTILKKAIKRYI